MEKIGKISNLGRKREFEMEKIAKISKLGRKKDFKMEKTVEIAILELGWKWHLAPVISYNKKPPIWQELTGNRDFREIDFGELRPDCIREVKKSKQQNAT